MGVVTFFAGSIQIITDEWRDARCWLDGYDGDCPVWNCPGICADCKFRVGILDSNTGDMLEMYGFKPEFQRGYRDGEIQIVGEPFRCCGREKPSDAMNCCSGFFDSLNEVFCDIWPHRYDSEGRSCPHGAWTCSYRLVGESIVTDVRPYVDQRAWHILYAG